MQLYKKLLDWLNIKYIVTKIKKPRFEELNLFISSIISILKILKIIIFINNIKMISKMAIHL